MTKEEKTKPKTNQPQPEASQIPAVKKKRKKSKGPLIYTVILVLALSFGTFFFVRYQQVNNKYQDLVMSEEDKVREIVKKVSKLYTIPSFEEEKPQSKIFMKEEEIKIVKSSNKFFKDVQINDVVLAYEKADIAVLFRPSENKIVATGTYEYATKASDVSVAIIAPADKQDTAEKTTKSIAKNLVIVSKTTPSGNITEGVVVDVAGKEKAAAEKIAGAFGLKVGNLPEGEKMPEGANFIVVLPNASPTTQAPQE